jgi:hypothetical protein
MKKLVIISILVTVLISGLVGGTVLAGAAKSEGHPVLMETGGDIVTVPSGPGYYGWGWFAGPGPVHVSLTVSTDGMDAGDHVDVAFMYVDEETGDWVIKTIRVLTDVDGTSTVEFDAARGQPSAGVYGNWQPMAYRNGTGYNVYYNYSMTYPKPK